MSFFDRLRGASAPAPTPAELARRLGVPPPDGPRALQLFGFKSCPYCQRVLRKAADLGLEIPWRDVHQDPEASRELLRLTRGTQVPCLVIDGQPLLESADIVAWLELYREHLPQA
ncbi:glutathione S-transferase N-terminal domain-containing protein [Myxococcota bacterium]|nr:glutathione S-transferase N-terminal domain-containing protein [Myxococcota bacterium]